MAGGSEVNAVGPVLQDGHPGGDHVVEQARKVGSRTPARRGPSGGVHACPAGRRSGSPCVRQFVAGEHRDPVVEAPHSTRAAHSPASLALMTTACSLVRPTGSTVLGTLPEAEQEGDAHGQQVADQVC